MDRTVKNGVEQIIDIFLPDQTTRDLYKAAF